jgi:sugar fermentation stimulation protein A
MPASLVGVNTGVPNRLVRESVMGGKISALKGYNRIRSEVPYGSRSRIDLLLEKGEQKCFVEIKNCTLVENGRASFPDAITTRGQKHLRELRRQVRHGQRGVIFFLVQRMDAVIFGPADRIDPEYGRLLREVVKDGVEILVYDVRMDCTSILINKIIPHDLSLGD